VKRGKGKKGKRGRGEEGKDCFKTPPNGMREYLRQNAFLDGLAKVVNILPYSPFSLCTKIIGNAKSFFRYDTCAKNPNPP
jgi:hypothetical protein